MCTTFKSKDVKIKKQQQCFSCFREFPIGTKMRYWSGLYEGDFNSNYTCSDCREIMSRSDEHCFEGGYVNEMRDYKEPIEDCIKRLLTPNQLNTVV